MNSPPSGNSRSRSGIHASDGLEIGIPESGDGGRPPASNDPSSSPTYQSPIRHHHRAASHSREVKETLNARTQYSNDGKDGPAQQRINQYLIKEEIGRGSFGSVHLAVDQYNQEYAVKEFSKTKLRKRLQSNLLRRPSARKRTGGILNYHRSSSNNAGEPLDLIREEIAIMKKLNHPNIVSLIEVLDDPEEDSLYMVMEMCNKGVVMKVGLDDRADPYDEEQCRHWFRDMILGIEYLHAQGIIHRDIKPDNCLITEDDILKITDFGVSEMFEKESDMHTTKSAGSPAFMPPELCVAKHGQISGKAADVWSMGVTLFCLNFGKIPFEKASMLELYEAIRSDGIKELDQRDIQNDQLGDLLSKLLDKDPQRRIDMDDVRIHPWVTKNGTDPLLSKEENTANLIGPPTEEEINAAITGNMGGLVTVMKAVRRFKTLLFRKRPDLLEGILGSNSRVVQPPQSIDKGSELGVRKSTSVDVHDRRPIGGALATEGVHHDIPVSKDMKRTPDQIDKVAIMAKVPDENASSRIQSENHPPSSDRSSPITPSRVIRPDAGKGHAHIRDPHQDSHYLEIGVGGERNELIDPPTEEERVVSESPGAVNMNVYDRAYEEEVERIKRDNSQGQRATLYLTRRVEDSKKFRQMEEFIASSRDDPMGATKTSLAGLLRKAANVKERVGSSGGDSGEGENEGSGPSETRSKKPSLPLI